MKKWQQLLWQSDPGTSLIFIPGSEDAGKPAAQMHN